MHQMKPLVELKNNYNFNCLKKVMNCFIPQKIETKGDSSRHKYNEKKDKTISSYTEEETKVHVDKRQNDLKSGQQLVFRHFKMRFLPKR